jgi:hypothetical protein
MFADERLWGFFSFSFYKRKLAPISGVKIASPSPADLRLFYIDEDWHPSL